MERKVREEKNDGQRGCIRGEESGGLTGTKQEGVSRRDSEQER